MPPNRMTQEERTAFQRRERRRRLLLAAAQEAVETGFHAMLRRAIAKRAGVANGTINHEFGTMAGLRDALIMDAIENRNLPVLAQGLACGHPRAKEAPEHLRMEAARELI